MDFSFLKYPEPKRVWLLTGDRKYYELKFSSYEHIKELELRFGSPVELVQNFFSPNSVNVFDDELAIILEDRVIKILKNRPFEALKSFSTVNPTLLCNHPLVLSYVNCYHVLKDYFTVEDVRFLGTPIFERQFQKWQLIERTRQNFSL